MVDVTFSADPGTAQDDTMGTDLRSVSNRYISLHNCVRSDFNVRSKLGLRINDGRWVNGTQAVLLYK